jgi:riboflavin transporter FmnP
LRSGGSQLSVTIDAKVEAGDRIRRTTQIDFEGPMATWMRWGFDNIGNESLDSLSQWKQVQGTTSTEATRNNHQVDSAEVQALETHLSGKASSLKRFMFDGLMIDCGRLIGVEPIAAAAAPTVEITVHDDFGFSDSKITITIESLENIKVGEKKVLFDNFVRPQPSATPFWTDLTIDAKFTTSLMVGTSAVDGSGIGYSHNRFIITESIGVSGTTLSGEEDMKDYRVAFVIGDITHAPLITLFESFAIVVLFSMLARRLTENKPRTGYWLTSLLFTAVWGYAYFFALPLFFMLAALVAAGIMMLAVAVVTPKISLEDSLADEAAYLSIMPTIGKRKRKVANPVVECPVCLEAIEIKSKQRPVRVRCDICDTKLKIS